MNEVVKAVGFTPEQLKKMRQIPEAFIEAALGDTLESYQKKICQAVAMYSKVEIKACHSVGKTFTLGGLVLWFISCFHPSIVITTAPTNRQVEMLLWGEINSAYRRSKFPIGGRITNKKLTIAPDWYAVGFSPEANSKGDSKEQVGSTFQGFHAENVLVVFDEATGIPHDIWVQVEGLLTSGAVVKFVCIGNPTTKNCDFYQVSLSAQWHHITITCFDSPNLRANNFFNIDDLKNEVNRLMELSEPERLKEIEAYKKPVPHLLSAQFVLSKLLPTEWGFNHPLTASKILGQYPDQDDSSLIPESDVLSAMARNTDIKDNDVRGIGIDVARFGVDSSFFTEIVGDVETRTKKRQKQDLMATTGDVVQFLKTGDHANKRTIVCVDSTGLGSGVYDRLVELKREGIISHRTKIVEVHFGQSPDQHLTDQKEIDKAKENYTNLKARIFNELAEDLKSELKILSDSIYIKELPTIKHKFDSKGRLYIESKDEYKARTGLSSPDASDSLALANMARRLTPDITLLSRLSKR